MGGSSEYGQTLNINADVAARELAAQVQPLKVVYISQQGGLLDDNRKVISEIDLNSESCEELQSQPWFKHGDRLKLKTFKLLLSRLAPRSSIAVTSSERLSQELFSHKGSGTL